LSKPDDALQGLYVVFAQPVDGREAEFNRWYSDQHLPDLMAVPGGFTAARRFRLAPEQRTGSKSPFPYMALYEIRGDIQETFAAVDAAKVRGAVPLSSAFAPERTATHLWLPMGDWRTRQNPRELRR